MTLIPAVSVDQFDGLQLGMPPAQVGAAAAVDLLDVDWDTRGVLGSRMGVEAFAAGLAHNYDVIFGAGVGFLPLGETFALLARRGELLVILNEAGAEVGDTLAVQQSRLNFVQMGQSTLTPVTYIANQDLPVRKFDGTEFSEPPATVDGVGGGEMPKAHFLANWQDGANRLVIANTTLEGGPGSAAGSPSHVFFSEPGQPEHFESTGFVELNPGDGQQILGIATWGRNVFVFKETYCFVFYGISADVEGRPIFNFHTIDLGTRAIPPRAGSNPHVVAGRDGVYFVARDGVWVTDGGAPVLVTGSLNFNDDRRDQRTELGGLPIPSWTHVRGIVYLEDCLYIGVAEVAAEDVTPITRTIKLDLVTGRVTYWQTAMNAFTIWSPTWEGIPRLFFSGAGGANKGIYFFSPETDVDPVVDMNPYWESGGYDVGQNPDEKTVTYTKVWGSGEVTVGVGEDFKAIEREKLFKLGVGAAIAQQQQSQDQSATLLSHRISGDAPWSVQRLTRYLSATRPPVTQKGS